MNFAVIYSIFHSFSSLLNIIRWITRDHDITQAAICNTIERWSPSHRKYIPNLPEKCERWYGWNAWSIFQITMMRIRDDSVIGQICRNSGNIFADGERNESVDVAVHSSHTDANVNLLCSAQIRDKIAAKSSMCIRNGSQNTIFAVHFGTVDQLRIVESLIKATHWIMQTHEFSITGICIEFAANVECHEFLIVTCVEHWSPVHFVSYGSHDYR